MLLSLVCLCRAGRSSTAEAIIVNAFTRQFTPCHVSLQLYIINYVSALVSTIYIQNACRTDATCTCIVCIEHGMFAHNVMHMYVYTFDCVYTYMHVCV